MYRPGFRAYDHIPSYTRRVYGGFGGISGYMMGWVYEGLKGNLTRHSKAELVQKVFKTYFWKQKLKEIYKTKHRNTKKIRLAAGKTHYNNNKWYSCISIRAGGAIFFGYIRGIWWVFRDLGVYDGLGYMMGWKMPTKTLGSVALILCKIN